ncbi:MAG: hypothetical protein WBF81_03900 [Thermoplasmata archaeon]
MAVAADAWGACRQCRAPFDHEPAKCPLCVGFSCGHIGGLDNHFTRTHGLRSGSRARAMAMDVARAQVRGWPLSEPMRKLRDAIAVDPHERIRFGWAVA